jgi:TRAP-type C4-dicarboxylate transport system permease small subunit
MAYLSRAIGSLISGILAGIGAAFISTVALAIINLYLTGHNITWQENTINFSFISMSFLDLTMMSCTITAMIAVAYLSYQGKM